MTGPPYLARLDLPEAVRLAVVPVLQARLGDTLDLSAQFRQAQWNVMGPRFIVLHDLFGRLAEESQDHGTAIAERILALGGLPDGRVEVTAGASRLPRFPDRVRLASSVLRALARALAHYGRGLGEGSVTAAAVGDLDSADLLAGLCRHADEAGWLVLAHQQLRH